MQSSVLFSGKRILPYGCYIWGCNVNKYKQNQHCSYHQWTFNIWAKPSFIIILRLHQTWTECMCTDSPSRREILALSPALYEAKWLIMQSDPTGLIKHFMKKSKTKETQQMYKVINMDLLMCWTRIKSIRLTENIWLSIMRRNWNGISVVILGFTNIAWVNKSFHTLQCEVSSNESRVDLKTRQSPLSLQEDSCHFPGQSRESYRCTK